MEGRVALSEQHTEQTTKVRRITDVHANSDHLTATTVSLVMFVPGVMDSLALRDIRFLVRFATSRLFYSYRSERERGVRRA
jgi:hypothetical protein